MSTSRDLPNTLAIQSATGSGKTLLMHVNILQYRHYLEKHRRSRDLNRVILVTPNESLSAQHLAEFGAAGIQAEIFNKDGRGLFAGRSVEIIDIHKLKDEMGDKTVAVDAFENNNLVLIDEGHRGVGSGETGTWMRFRNALSERGFSFEYSATFEQAVKGDKKLTAQYARSILFDYSYRYFYGDGYGKDYQILNLDEATEQNHLDLYLTACVLAHVQQLRLFRNETSSFTPFNIEKPLLIFVGSSVTKSLSKKDASDVVDILRFISRFVGNRQDSIARIERILSTGLTTADGKNIFSGRFKYLNGSGLSPSDIFDESLRLLFNAPGGGQLYAENLKGADGEVALRIGASGEAFGVIYVGDDTKLVDLCAKNGIATGEREFSRSLFEEINQSDSSVNVLIGAKKFTEGWSSWRVSTMGLMNVGKSEGAQIIQLFGRGVRLKGYDGGLRRSSRIVLPDDLTRPKYLTLLETLNVFGIQADYMAQFRELLLDEGLPPNDDRVEFFLPVIRQMGSEPLRMIRLKKTIDGKSTDFGDAFRKLAPVPTIGAPPEELLRNPVALNWYPKVRAMASKGVAADDEAAAPNEGKLQSRHVAFLDIDALFFEVQRFKAERGWYNLNLTREAVTDLLDNPGWYHLEIPEEELLFDDAEKVDTWQEIAGSLLKKYVERYYLTSKKNWERPHLEYQVLSENDPNFLVREPDDEPGYRILLDASDEDILAKLRELKNAIESGSLKALNFNSLRAINFDRHLYAPLLYLESNVIDVTPVALNTGERRFVEDLKRFYTDHTDFFEGRELYLLRNLSKGRGVGFFEAGNFHPDFILWLIGDKHQYVTFVDPKGLRNVGPTDPKVRFHETIKELENRLGAGSVTLNSFIISNTSFHTLTSLWGEKSKEDMAVSHVLFQEDEGYIQQMLKMMTSPPTR